MAINNPSQEKLHYDSLISLFKYVIGATTLIVGFIVFLIGNSLNEIKKTINEDVKLSSMKLDSIKTDAKRTMAEAKGEATVMLQYTKDITDLKIALLRDNAIEAAKSSAENRVNDFFRSYNLQSYLDTTTRKVVSIKLNAVVKEETDKTRDIFKYMSKIQILYDRIGKQDVAALYELDSLSNYCDNEAIQKLSKELLIQRGKEFDENYKFVSFSTTAVADSEDDFLQVLGLSTTSTTEEIGRKVVYEIKQHPQLSTLTRYYLLLRRKTGIDFKTFDSKPVFDWYNSNYRKK
jgi:hypothetical protein